MPAYDFLCTNEQCQHIEEDLQLSFTDDLNQVKCPLCTTLMKNISFGGIGTVFKGMWVDKNLKVKTEKQAKSKKLEKKQRDEHAPMQLVPNIGGVECDSFKDAAKLAKEAGLNHQSYQKYAEKEKNCGRYQRPH